ncbi:hypothetical protein APY04_2286 [Hyphomicrobium sulfonivorans]|uniref:DUF2059 domain-containing protein n=1 Tax=Hyphomicrobium sulfonivorans TaxID=121290 RepID=A0A109BE01_HYPSL|nr:DUF2059 domain-containing protein [Hyphomicrobium sulfonivorans]KWT66879.1 hypothetical protein APY04_2286 [Hyphomicrobium sulfonivorans]
MISRNMRASDCVMRRALMACVVALGMLVSAAIVAGVPALAEDAAAGLEAQRIAAAHELMEVTGVNAQLDGMVDIMSQGFRKGAGDAGGKTAADKAGEEFDRFMQRMLSYRQAMLDDFAKMYADRFTLEELRAVTEFYRSDAGQKFIKAMPELMQQGGQLGIKYSQKALQDMKDAKP